MKKIFLSAILIFSVTLLSAQKTYILCGKLIDTKSGKIENKKTIVVQGNKITNIHNGYIHPKNRLDRIINLKDKTVMPGLIDNAHTHRKSV